jgi:hypothetical protein
MKAAVWLRIASVLTLIHGVLHTIGGVFGSPDAGVQQTVWDAMRSNTFKLMGNERSYFHFYRGMGLAVTVFLVLEAVVFWQLGSLAKTDGWRLRPVLATFVVGYLCLAVNSYKYFFFGPVITEVLIAVCLVMAIVGLRVREA